MFVGIDLGTSAVKAVLVDDQERIAASAQSSLSPSCPKPGWSEDNPEAWWKATDECMKRLRADQPDAMRQVQAIGLSGQMHACLLLDSDNRPVRPAILWNDGRSDQEAAALARLDPTIIERAGVKPSAGFTGPKISWLRKHEPAVLDDVATLLLPKDLLRLRMTGERATDPSDAAGTWLLDEASRTWSPEAIAACGVEPEWLPPIVESNQVGGHLRASVAEAWGLSPGLPVACGGGDTAVGGVGIGAVNPGDGFVSLGTSAQVFVADDRLTSAPERLVHSFCHAVPERWYSMAALLNGASALAAAVSWTGNADISAVLGRVEASYSGPGRLLALPYLAGERTPHDDPHARGCILGLTADTKPEEIVLAMLEGVAFSLADGLEALRSAREVPTRLAVIGGGARSTFWASLISSILRITLVRYHDAHHGPAFGAARLARLAVSGEEVEDVAWKPSIDRIFKPNEHLTRLYEPRLEAFRRVYRALAPEFRAH